LEHYNSSQTDEAELDLADESKVILLCDENYTSILIL